MNSLVQAASSIGIPIGDAQIEQFQRYRQLLLEWSQRMNLTAVNDPDAIVEELFIRSLRVATPAGGNVSTSEWFSGRRIIDIGAGGGVPGLPLKIALPDANVTLLESNRKKCDFMAHVVSDLKLGGVVVLNARAEEAAHSPEHRESYDLATARGVASLSALAEYALPFLKLGGVAVLPKGPDLEGIRAESEDAAYAAKRIGAAPAIIHAVSHPGNSPIDNTVYWLKVNPTPDRFPRRAGMPTKRPLTASRKIP